VRQIQCFKRVPARMHLPDLGRPWAAIFVWPVPTAFDLLALNGREARPRPLTDRQACLQALLERSERRDADASRLRILTSLGTYG
jgi:hypothetical protein